MKKEYQVGSPPPMRGKVGLGTFEAYRSGITPAYAGKSLGCFFSSLIDKDHPRLCGEKWARAAG